MLTMRQLCFLGHISRMPDMRLPNQLLVCAPVGGGLSIGGQKRRWNDLVQSDLIRCGLEEDWHVSAQNSGKE